MKQFFNLDSIKGRIAFYLFQIVAAAVTDLLFVGMVVQTFMSLGGHKEWMFPTWLVVYFILTIWWARGSRYSVAHVMLGFVVMVGCGILELYLFFT